MGFGHALLGLANTPLLGLVLLTLAFSFPLPLRGSLALSLELGTSPAPKGLHRIHILLVCQESLFLKPQLGHTYGAHLAIQTIHGRD